MRDEPPITETDLQAYADGRLAEDRRDALADWLAARPADAERVAAYRHLREAIRATYDPVLAQPLPRQLARPEPRRRWWRPAAAVAASILVGTMAGWQLRDWDAGALSFAMSGEVLAHRAAVAHATYAPEFRHPVEVNADQEQHLVTWLSQRLEKKINAPRLQEFGMSLVGGRLLPGETAPVALLMYENPAGRRVTIYILGERVQRVEDGRRYAQQNRVNVFYWMDAEWACAVSSADLSKEELQRIADVAYKQLEESS